MGKKEERPKPRERHIDHVPVSKRMLKNFYMVRLGLTREEVAAGAGVSLSTLGRMFRRGKATVRSGGLVLLFFEERVKKWNAQVTLDNAKRNDGAKEELIPMITSLSEYPPGYPLGDKVGAGVNEAPVGDAGESTGACRDAGAGCPAVGVLEHSLREVVKEALAGKEREKDRMFVIRLAPDDSVSVVEIRDSSGPGVPTDKGVEDALRQWMRTGLTLEMGLGKREPLEKRQEGPKNREFIARWIVPGGLRIIEIMGQSGRAPRADWELFDPKWEGRRFLDVEPKRDDRKGVARWRQKLSWNDNDPVWFVLDDGRRMKAGKPGN